MKTSSPLVSLASSDLAAFGSLASPGFLLAPHVELLINTLEAVERGHLKRVIISAPPRHGKSFLTSQLFPAWYLGRDPKRLVVGASHSAELAELFGRRVRNMIQEDRFRATFPGCKLSSDSAAAARFDTTKGGGYFGIGRGGGLTGRGADLVIIDDPIRGPEEAASPAIRQALHEWFASVVYTRLQPGGAIVIVSTRWHLDDLAGHLLAQHSDDWKTITLPAFAEPGDVLGRTEGEALWPERFSVEALESIRAQMSSPQWLALYQCRPVPEGGAIFELAWFPTYREVPSLARVVQAWDTAYGKATGSGDWSACATIGEAQDGFYVLDVTRGRWSFPDLKRKMAEHAARFNPCAVVVEDTGSGTSVLQELRGGTTLPLIAVSPEGSKELRAQVISPLCEARKVLLPESAAWKAAFVDELLSFPAGAHDDMVDSFVHCLTRLRGSGAPAFTEFLDRRIKSARYEELKYRLRPAAGGDPARLEALIAEELARDAAKEAWDAKIAAESGQAQREANQRVVGPVPPRILPWW